MRKFLTLFTMLMLCGVLAFSQGRTISGTVTDASGNSIQGVSVTAGNVGTQTDENGYYSLTVPTSARTLSFSSVGFVSQQIAHGSRSTINVTLVATEADLEEVVVIGYGTIQKTAFTGSASKINVDEFNTLVTPSIDKQLAGRATGVQVLNNSGQVNAPANIRIRGINSLSQSNAPLIVVDGFPITTGNLSATTNSNALADINPNDIADMQILKDGSATAIYGSRAAAGVILITTKQGQKGKLKFNYDGTYGWSKIAKKYDLLNADQFVTIANEKLANAPTPLAPRAGVNPGGVNTDWQDVVFINNAPVQNHNISMSGGSDKTRFFISLNYGDQKGVVKSNWNKLYRVRANVESEINKLIRIGNNISISRQENTDQNTGGNSLGGAIASSLRMLPNVSPFDSDDESGFNIDFPSRNSMTNGPNTQGVDDNWFNVAFVLDKNKFYSEQYRIIDNAFIELNPFKGFKFRSQASFDMLSDYAYQAWDPRHGDGYSSQGYGYNASQNFIRYGWQNYINYNLNLNNHNFFLTAGHELNASRTKWMSASGSGLTDLFFMQNNIISGSLPVSPSIGGSYSKSGFESLFGRLNYDFDGKYFMQASFRRDGQSSLSPGNKYGIFPGFSVGWRPSEESFWSGMQSIINDLKIKASYAKVGNTLGGLPYLSTFGNAPYGNLGGIAVNAIGNPDLKWETSAKYDIGAEISLLNRRLDLTVDWFMNDVDNLVLNVPTPLSAGIPGNSIPQNIGALRNNGLELSINAIPVQTRDFKWNITFNYTNVRNEIIKLYSIGDKATEFIDNGNYNIIKVGHPMNIIWGYEYAGVNTQNGYPMYRKSDGKLVIHRINGGGYFFANDLKDPGNFSADNQTSLLATGDKTDKKKLGEALPTYFGAMINSLTYKRFTFDFMLRYSGGNKIMNYTRQEALLNQSFANNGKEILDRWQKPGDVTTVPKLIFGQSNNVNQNGLAISRFVEPGDYLRLQNVTLAYALNSADLQKLSRGYINSLKVYVQGQNLKVWTKYTGADPDNITTTGIEDPSLPPQIRTISIGLNLGF